MRITLDNSIDAKAYLASQVGPGRRAFGVRSSLRLASGESGLAVENATLDRVMFASVQVTSSQSASVETVFGNTTPSRFSDPTIEMITRQTFVDFVLLPGEQLWLANFDVGTATYSVARQLF